MLASSSCPTDPVLEHLTRTVDTAVVTGGGGLRAVLAAVTDPRKARGIRHRMVVIVSVAVCAVAAGARSFAAIGQWAATCGPDL
jgi:hypothetical protein